MVPPSPAADDHADPAWLARIRRLLRLNAGGVVIGLEGAHLACAGPLIAMLLEDGAEDGAEVRVCFEAREMLDAPEDARVVLLHAARDAEFLNLVRPAVAERRLRLLVWLGPGERRELSRRARDFLDWMQESVDIPEFAPAYARAALDRVLHEGAAICWEGRPLTGLVPAEIVLRPGDDEQAVLEAMRAGPVVVHRPRREEIARFEAMHRAAGHAFGIIWDEPAIVPPQAERIIAEPLDWEEAAEWLGDVGVENPRIEAAKLQLDPMAISARVGRAPPDRLASDDRAEGSVSRGLERPRSIEPSRAPTATGDWWERLFALCVPSGPPDDPALIVSRPSAWPGLGSLADRIRDRSEPELHMVTGGRGSGVSTELLSLGLRLHDRCCVVMLDVFEHFTASIGDMVAFDRIDSWELVLLLGVATVRVGRDRWGVRWGTETSTLSDAISAGTGTWVDVDRLASALAGVSAPDDRMRAKEEWRLPLGTHRVQPSSADADASEKDRPGDNRVIEELVSVFRDPDNARLLAMKAGFPAAMLPKFQTPMLFWHRVVQTVEDGLLEGGLRPIIQAAANMFPHNAVFASHLHPRSLSRFGISQIVTRAVRRVVEELRASTGREVVFLIDGLDRLRLPWIIKRIFGSRRLTSLSADLVVSAPYDPRSSGTSPIDHVSFDHVSTFSHLDDIPVVDVHEPTHYGPGIGFFRELIERRFASIPGSRPSIPDDVLDRLAWASGGRPMECLELLREMAWHAHGAPHQRLPDIADEVVRKARQGSAPSREEHTMLGALLRDFVTNLPSEETAREAYQRGLLRMFPSPDGGYRALPHPLLIEDFARS